MTLHSLAAWRLSSTANDGTTNDTYCDLWLDDRLSPLSTSTLIGESLKALCSPQADGSITCVSERPGPYVGYTAKRVHNHNGAQNDERANAVDLTFEAGPLGQLAPNRRKACCRCGCQQIDWADDDPGWIDFQHPYIHERWELGVPLSRATRQAIREGVVPTVRPGIIRITDLWVREDGYHDLSLPGMLERNEVARTLGRELGMSAPESITTYLAIRDNRAVGVLIPDENSHRQGVASSDMADTVRSVWVAGTWRGRGVAEDLTAAFHDPTEASRRYKEHREVYRKLKASAVRHQVELERTVSGAGT